jgi:hypothetical protein
MRKFPFHDAAYNRREEWPTETVNKYRCSICQRPYAIEFSAAGDGRRCGICIANRRTIIRYFKENTMSHLTVECSVCAVPDSLPHSTT